MGKAVNLTVKNGDISGTIVGSYDDFAIRTEIKKGESSLPENKDGGEKTLDVSANNGDVNIEFSTRDLVFLKRVFHRMKCLQTSSKIMRKLRRRKIESIKFIGIKSVFGSIP